MNLRVKSRDSGVALLFTLSIGTILILLAVSLLSLYSSGVQAQAQQQNGLQAYWSARAGVVELPAEPVAAKAAPAVEPNNPESPVMSAAATAAVPETRP